MVKDTVKENGYGIMDKSTKVHGILELKVVKVHGNPPKEILTKANGSLIVSKERVFTDTKVVPIKVNSFSP